MSRKNKGGNCPVCGVAYHTNNWRSGHHILPKRFFHGIGGIYYMCRQCHNELEFFIPQKKLLEEEKYWQILIDFIKRKHALLNFKVQLN